MEQEGATLIVELCLETEIFRDRLIICLDASLNFFDEVLDGFRLLPAEWPS